MEAAEQGSGVTCGIRQGRAQNPGRNGDKTHIYELGGSGVWGGAPRAAPEAVSSKLTLAATGFVVGEGARWWFLDVPDDGVLVELLFGDEFVHDGEADVRHVVGQVVREFLPRGEDSVAEAAGFVLGQLGGFLKALFDFDPGRDVCQRVSAVKMIEEVIAPGELFAAVVDVAGPPPDMPVRSILVEHPVGLPLEHLALIATLPCAGEGLNVLVHMIGPVTRYLELLCR